MRKNPYFTDAQFLKYGIRELIDMAQKLGELIPDFNFVGENIGDPIAKGWDPPPFMKQILAETVTGSDREVYAYTHSRGRIPVRKWVAELSRKHSPGSTLDYEDVVFFSGLGSGICMLYQMLAPGARVLQPCPSYPTHASFEAFHAGAGSIGYRLDPANGWRPDIEHIEEQVKNHPEITGILLINPNNPTGMVYDADTLERIIQIAERYGLMIISDEIYFRLVFNNNVFVQITEMARGRVPLVVLRGSSKDIPWPGGRCGWAEFHNCDIDGDFRLYADSIKKRIMIEVCSTTLPQYVLPMIYDHPDFEAWIESSRKTLENTSNLIVEMLSPVKGIEIRKIGGAFYLLPVFNDGVLNDGQSLPIAEPSARRYVEDLVNREGVPHDKRFAFYLLASTGICVVPASDMYSPAPGFRVTALDRNPERLRKTYQTIASSIESYLASN